MEINVLWIFAFYYFVSTFCFWRLPFFYWFYQQNLNCILNSSCFLEFTGESANLLEWHNRRAIAIGIAKGLRFLHEECRGGPIIHRDLRPSNILLTHDFVPMVLFCILLGIYDCNCGDVSINIYLVTSLCNQGMP